MTELDQKAKTSPFGMALREKFHLNSAHPDLHKWIYALCAPSAIVALNGILYYVVHGEGARWPVFRGSGWAADGRQPLSAPGGGVCGWAKPTSAPSAKS